VQLFINGGSLSSPTFPNIPFPPILDAVATTFKDWEKYLSNKPEHYVNVIAFKIIMFAHLETVFSYGYLVNIGQDEVFSGEARVEDEDHTFNPEVGWQGGDNFGAPSLKKVPVTAKLNAIKGHAEIIFDLGAPQQFHYTAVLSAISGKDPSVSSSLMLTGDRTSVPGGKVLATFSKESFEKTHWPPA
jgi:hypothetical protein